MYVLDPSVKHAHSQDRYFIKQRPGISNTDSFDCPGETEAASKIAGLKASTCTCSTGCPKQGRKATMMQDIRQKNVNVPLHRQLNLSDKAHRSDTHLYVSRTTPSGRSAVDVCKL